MMLEEWRELNRLRVKNLYATMRALYDSVAGPGTIPARLQRGWAVCMVTATTSQQRHWVAE